MKKIDITHRIKTTTSDGTPVGLYPLDEYLSDILLDFILSESFTDAKELSDKNDGSLTLVDYKPMATFSFVNSPGYMPFIIELSTPPKAYNLGDSAYIKVSYGEKTTDLNLGNLSRVIKAYDFWIYKKTVYVNIIQGATVKDFAFDVVFLEYTKGCIDTRFGDLKLVETKIKTLIQTLESAIPTLRKDFHIEYKFYTNRYNVNLKYPYIFLIPEGIVNDISDFLLSQYQQNYGIITKLPPEFVPNENVQSPELKKFTDKLPLDMIAKTVIGTYGSAPAVLLPEGDYSQYLTGNEHVINLGKGVVIVFGNPQQVPAPQQTPTPEQQTPTTQAQEQQNVEQNKEEENSNIEQNNIAERLGKEIQSIYESIIEDNSINDEEKKNRLEKLNSVLNELGKAILVALKSQTPLKANELRKYADDIAKNGGLSYINNFENYLDYYEHSLTETEELEVLATLLTYIGNTMYGIDKKIKEDSHLYKV
jgi:hypothetical protein